MDSSWIPARGRHPVSIGSSLGRTLKARKSGAAPAAKRSNLPERDFYSFRYNFKPGTVDPSRPGTFEIRTDQMPDPVVVEQPSTKVDEIHSFKGREQPAKEVDCVLIYDEESGTFTLEKLDSCMNLKFQRKPASVPVPPPSPPQAAISTNGPHDSYEDDLERDLLGLAAEEDADGDPDEDLEEVIPKAVSYTQEEEEEEEGEVGPSTPQPPRVPTPPPPVVPKPARQVKPMPKRQKENPQPPQPAPAPPAPAPKSVPAPPPPVPTPVAAPPKPRPTTTKVKKDKPDVAPAISQPDEEELAFGEPAKRARPSPPEPPAVTAPLPSGLALPGASSSFTSLPSGTKPSASSSSRAVPPPAPLPPPLPVAADSDEEEEWDEVQPMDDSLQPADDIFGDDSEAPRDMGFDDLEMELNQELEESDPDEDFLTAVVEEAPVTPQIAAQPISLNKLAGGGEASDDEYSSSDDDSDY